MICSLLALALAASPTASPTATGSPQDQLKQASATYDYGNYAAAAEQLDRLTQARVLEHPQDQIEAYRLLGLARFFSKQTEEARRAFLNLLSLDPDFQLDPLYVPPQAVAFFEGVRHDNQPLLEPIRERRRATQQAIAQEEVARQRLLAQGGPTTGPTTVVRERVDRPSAPLALLPFGIGQFQNGNRGLGTAFAVAETLALASSIGCYLWVESQRSSDGTYTPALYPTARALEAVQIATATGFLGLWVLGATEALWNLRPATVVREDEPSPAPALVPKVSFSFNPLPGGALGGLQGQF